MKERDESSKFTVTIHDTIEEINCEEWNELVHHTMFRTCDWMQVLEASVQDEVTPFYITVCCKNRLVGAGVCYSLTRSMVGFRVPIIACTYPLSESMALFVKENEDSCTIFDLLCTALETIARQEKAWGILITCAPDGPYQKILKRKGFHMLNQIPTTYLDIPWKTFKEYLKSLPRKAKKNIRHTLNQGKRKGLKLEHSQDFSDIEHLYNLFRATMERHRHEHLIPCTLDVFKNFENYVSEYTYIVRCSHEENLLGYWLYFFDGNTASLAISGIDKTYAKEYNTYFNICYDAIREMIEKGCKRAWFGITTYDVKRRIGCTLKRTKTAVKLRNPVLNMLVKPLVLLRNIQVERQHPE